MSKGEIWFYTSRVNAHRAGEPIPGPNDEFFNARRSRLEGKAEPEINIGKMRQKLSRSQHDVFCMNCTRTDHHKHQCTYCFTCDILIEKIKCETCGQAQKESRVAVNLTQHEKFYYSKRIDQLLNGEKELQEPSDLVIKDRETRKKYLSSLPKTSSVTDTSVTKNPDGSVFYGTFCMNCTQPGHKADSCTYCFTCDESIETEVCKCGQKRGANRMSLSWFLKKLNR